MASGYQKATVDLDTLFMARVNAKIGDVNYQVGGVDISNRYESRGAGTKIADVGFQAGGVDLSNYFRNISEPLVTFPIGTLTCTAVTGIAATAQYQLRTDGNIFGTNGSNALVDRGDWISPQSGMAGYEAQATFVSGGFTGGNGVGTTWWPLTSNVVWTHQETVQGANSNSVISIKIRRASDLVVVAGPVNITLYAERLPA